jgi:GT2 family glycosyltransferase
MEPMPFRAQGAEARVAPVTVVLPTIGRPDLVRGCLESLARCAPRADEIIVIDSSEDDAVARVVSAFADVGTRAIPCRTPGIGSAFNLGLREARHEIVLLTNDDCTVEPSWVERGQTHLRAGGDAIVTGRVRPDGDPRVVPSTIDDPVAREHVGSPDFVLFTQCMALTRSTVLAFGGFDEQVRPSAEDNDLSYRWLRAGRRIHYEPDFVVWHHDWRTRDQLERLYVNYGIGQGMVYGKHLRRGDLLITRYLLADLSAGCRGVIARAVLGPRPYADPRLGLLRGLPVGLARGWRAGRAPSAPDADGGEGRRGV